MEPKATRELITPLRYHLRRRYCSPSKYRVFLDDKEGVATFLLYDLSGALAGYQQYRPAADKVKNNHPKLGRYYTYRDKQRLGVFGLETWSYSEPLFICEGIFDAMRLHNRGLSAIATLSNDPKFLDEWFFMIQRPIYGVLDSGKAGAMLGRYCDKSYTCPVDVDLGAMEPIQVNELLKQHFQI